jgi:signal peptidase II
MLRWVWLSGLIIVLDLITKSLATSMLNYGEPVPVMAFFNLTLLHNTGAAFSFLADASGWQRWFFVSLALIVSVSLLVWLGRLKPGERWLAVSLSLVLGGAVGNLYDRIVHGYVVDFIHLYYDNYHFPAFNIADCAISVGAIMMAIDIFREDAGSTSRVGAVSNTSKADNNNR